jgi:hypothetical protein
LQQRAPGEPQQIQRQPSQEQSSEQQTKQGKSKAGTPSARKPTSKEARRVAREFRTIALTADSVEGFTSKVEQKANGDLGVLGADCVVFSLSGLGGYIGAFGAGFEVLYSPRFGWATYFQAGPGLATPGAGAALEVGLIWDLGDPSNYTGSFIEVTGTVGPGAIGYWPGMGSASGSVTPADVANVATGEGFQEPRGIKVGGGYGTPGAQLSVLGEYYLKLSGTAKKKPAGKPQKKEGEERGTTMDVIKLSAIAGSAALSSPWRPDEWTFRGRWTQEEKMVLQSFGRVMQNFVVEKIRTMRSEGNEDPFTTLWSREDKGSVTVRERLGGTNDYLLQDVVAAANAVSNRKWGGDVLDMELFNKRSYLQIMRLLEDADLITTYGKAEGSLRKTVSE